MEVVSTVISIITCLCTPNCLHKPLSHHCSYLRRHQEKAEIMGNKMEVLSAQATNVKGKLGVANLQEGKEPNAEVVLWLEKVQIIEKEVHSLMEKVGEEKRCFNGCFPNYCSRLKLGKYIEEKTKMVTQLLGQGQFSNDQLTDLQQEKGKPLPTTTLVGKTTAERNFEKIWEYIMDDGIGKIGVYGMGGVGKTAIMQHIHNCLLKERTRFNKVIWITVSKDSNLDKLQNNIGEALDLKISNYNDEMKKAGEILAALMRRKSFVLILDDMWQAFPLENVGIPNPTRENGCKVVFTTRLQGVCRGMETQKMFEVMVLSEEEAWELFKEKIGEGVLLSSDIQALAKDVAKECDGLPLALITVGRALRQVHDIMEWKNALNELRASNADIEGLEDKVFKSLEFSYSRLRNAQLRSCFLYCALYPEDAKINVEELIDYLIGEGLIDGLESREVQICKVRTILNELKYACMLENGYDHYGKEYVKMHDLIRDLAIRIQKPTCIIKAGFGLTKAPRDEEWIEQLQRVSLVRNNLEHLMGEPKCPKLSSLFLQYNSRLWDISPSFFQHMYNLRVVNLSDTAIEFLPKSILELENLRALLLHKCKKLRQLPSLANLKSLRTLDLSDSLITELPLGMEMLVNLRRLDLRHCFELKMFPAKLLQNLNYLDELSVHGDIFRWGSYDAVEEAEGGAYAEELISATHLRNLQVHFSNREIFHSYMRSGHLQQLTNFILTIGLIFTVKPTEFGKNFISITSENLIVGGTCLVLPDTTHVLDITECDITRLSMCLSNSAQLKQCYLSGCKQMECIVIAGENNLPLLERMCLFELPNLRYLYRGAVVPGTLSCLKFLVVSYCNKLKNLLTCGLSRNLQSLEAIRVEECDKMEEIVGQGQDDDKEIQEEGTSGTNNDVILPSLRWLELIQLRELKSICSGGVMVCNSLHTIRVSDCKKLKQLPIISTENRETLAPPALRKTIIGNKAWWDPLKRDHPDTRTFVQPFSFDESKLHNWSFPEI